MCCSKHSGCDWCVWFAAAEGLPHSVPGAGAGKPEGGAGDQEQPFAPEGKEAHGNGQTGGFISLTHTQPLHIMRVNRLVNCNILRV